MAFKFQSWGEAMGWTKELERRLRGEGNKKKAAKKRGKKKVSRNAKGRFVKG
jgi:hypothetical protein